MDEQKWADRKRALPLAKRLQPPPQQQQQLDVALSGRGVNGVSPKPAVAGFSVAPIPLPAARVLKRRNHRTKHAAREDTLPELAASNDEASGDDGVTLSPLYPANSPTPRITDLPQPAGKRFSTGAVLADLKAPPLSLLARAPNQPTIDAGDNGNLPSIAKPMKDYHEVMRRAREQRKLPHEREISPRRARGGSAGSNSARRHAATPPPSLSEPRATDEGAFVAQPQSALLNAGDSEAEGEFEFNGGDPETDAAVAGLVTARRTGRIRVVVRKRPIRENEPGEDCVEVTPPGVHIGAIKQRVDLSEYTENHDYAFDDAFGESHNNEAVYRSCGRALIDTVYEGGSASCFAYGQTGSGKTHTMIGTEHEAGMYIMAAQDIFQRLQPEHHVFVSLYEIYCNSLFDLLNYRTVVVAREDANKKVNICGLTWHEITSVDDLRDIIDRGTVQRRTGSTSANEFSSRSHAVLTITLRDEARPKFCGSLNVVDLAGSERAADTAANDKQTRLEGAEINKSLLALKECIRGLDERKRHIPFRGSKLTEVLRDSFVGNSRTVMVATISPSIDSVEHTLNTLRYAFRVKGLTIAQVDPSRERNAPRPAPVPQQRTKSVDPQPSAVPLLPPVRKKKKSREKKHRRDNSEPSTPRLQAEQIESLERGLKSEIQTLREEMSRIAAEKDENIGLLVEQNRRLEKELRLMRKLLMNAQSVPLDDVDTEEIA